MSVVYKILCEVRLLHEYYLTRSKGETVFDEALQDDRIQFLQQTFENGGLSVSRDIDFILPESQQEVFSNFHLRIVPTYSGFKLAVRCRRQKLGDGTTVFQPFVPLPPDLEISILLEPTNNISSFSAIPVSSPVRTAYYFTNDDFPATKTFPFLATAVPAFDAAKTYEQGELASFGITGVRMFLNNGAADPWLTLNGTGYISEADRFLAPLQMHYSFPAGSNIIDAAFVLRDSNSNTVKEFTITRPEAIRAVWLDFHTEGNTVRTIPGKGISAEDVYSLTVTGNNGYTNTLSLVFAADEINISRYAGMICLKPAVPVTAFNLLDNTGLLHTRIQPDNSRTPPPVFELWMKSRLVYWHYSNNERKKLKLITDTQDLLNNDNGVLISRDPRPLSYQPVLLKKPDSTFQFLPNPEPGEPLQISSNKQFVNILVPSSKLFPLE